MSEFNPQKDTGNVERYTQPHIIEAARNAMGGITLDPASCEKAQTIVSAKHYIALPNNGLDADWFGNVWVNWPYSRAEQPCKTNCKKKKCETRGYCTKEYIPGNIDWANKVIEEYMDSLMVTSICAITWLSGASDWFQDMLHESDAYCILKDRPHFIDPATMKPMPSAMKDAVVFYFGSKPYRFEGSFQKLGFVGRKL